MCFVYIINFCKGNINTYINFESSSSVTFFFSCTYIGYVFSFLYFNFILFSFICLVSQFISMFFFNLLVYSLNLALCLHLTINSHLLFNNFSDTGYIIICIFSSWMNLIYIYIYIYIYMRFIQKILSFTQDYGLEYLMLINGHISSE